MEATSEQTTTRPDLLQQARELQAAKPRLIQELLDKREACTKEYQATLAQIADDLKLLGWHRSREAKAATEGAATTAPKRDRKKKGASAQ